MPHYTVYAADCDGEWEEFSTLASANARAASMAKKTEEMAQVWQRIAVHEVVKDVAAYGCVPLPEDEVTPAEE